MLARMHYNGPAIKGGCVTRRIPVKAGFLYRAVICHWPEKEGMARVFAVMVQILLCITRVAVQVLSKPRIYPRIQSWLRALVQCRGTKLIGARSLSRCRNLIECRWACPGATDITNLSWVQEPSKNRDKQLTFIVRVRWS